MAATAPTPATFSATVSAITSAFGDPTRRGIYLFARGNEGGATAAQVAEEFGLHAFDVMNFGSYFVRAL